MSDIVKFSFIDRKSWSENFKAAPSGFQTAYNNATSREKSAVLLRWVKNPFTWIGTYQDLDIEDDYFFEFMLNNCGTSINEAAGAILRSKDANNHTDIDKKIIKLYTSNRKTGGFVPRDAKVKLDFKFEDIEGQVPVEETGNFDRKGLYSFVHLMSKVTSVPVAKLENSGLQYNSITVYVDCPFNQKVLIDSKDDPIQLIRLAMTRELACKLVGNSYVSMRVLNYITSLAQGLRDTYMLDTNYKELSHLILSGSDIPANLKHIQGDKSKLESVCLLTDELLHTINLPFELQDEIRKLCVLLNVKLSKYVNPKLIDFYHKIEVSYAALRVRNYVDLSTEITRGYVLPRDIVKYLDKYCIDECEVFRRLYFGELKDVELGDRLIKSVNEYNDYEINLITRGADGKKILRFLTTILLVTPSDILNFKSMPRNEQIIYRLLLLLSYEEQPYIIKGLLTGDEKYDGLVKNLLNYLVYWICRGHNEYIKPFFKLMSRFEYGAMFDSHKQVLNMIDSNSFLLYEANISGIGSSIISDDLCLDIVRSLLTQDWYEPKFLRKLPRNIGGIDFNQIYEYLGYNRLLKSEQFKTKFSQITDMEIYKKDIKQGEPVEDVLIKLLRLLNNVDTEVVRQRFNLTYHRDLTTSLIEIKTEAWNKYFSDIIGPVVFTELEFIGNNNQKTSKSSDTSTTYGSGNYQIVDINSDKIEYVISDGNDTLKITPGLKVKKYIGNLGDQSNSVKHKDQSVLNRLMNRYEKYKMNIKTKRGDEREDEGVPTYKPEPETTQEIGIMKEPFNLENTKQIINLIDEITSLFSIENIKNYISGLINQEDLSKLSQPTYVVLKGILSNNVAEFRDVLNANKEAIFISPLITAEILQFNVKIKNETRDFKGFKAKKLTEAAFMYYSQVKKESTMEDFLKDSEFKKYMELMSKNPLYSDEKLKKEFEQNMELDKYRRNTFNFFTKTKTSREKK